MSELEEKRAELHTRFEGHCSNSVGSQEASEVAAAILASTDMLMGVILDIRDALVTVADRMPPQ